MAERFEDFFGHEMDIVDQAAHLLSEAEIAYNNNELTKSEFDEIVEDVLELGQIDDIANSIEQKIETKEAYRVLRNIVEAIPFI